MNFMQRSRISGDQSFFEFYLESLDFIHDTSTPSLWTK